MPTAKFTMVFTAAASAVFTMATLYGPSVLARVQQKPAQYETQRVRQAQRLQKRIAREYGTAPSVFSLVDALAHRADILTRTTVVRFVPNEEAVPPPWRADVSAYAHWVVYDNDHKTFAIDERMIAWQISQGLVQLPQPSSAQIIGSEDRWGYTHLTMTGSVRNGYAYDRDVMAQGIAAALDDNERSVAIRVAFSRGEVYDETGKTWQLLSTGRTNFGGSPAGRKANIVKGMREHLDGIVIGPGQRFSFNSILGGSVNYTNGWFDSLIIVNGRDLRQAPGGGICQVATTFYRSALLAGLPVVKRKNHSLYVTYYKKYGIGLDATIFPGQQDLVVDNDTPSSLLIRAYTVGDEAIVQLFGTPDNRTVAMDGPYFKGNTISWNRTVRYADGREAPSSINSRYFTLPSLSLTKEYADGKAMQELHAAAPTL